MKYLTAQDILVIHALVVDETGGAHGIRDVGLLASAANRPRATSMEQICTRPFLIKQPLVYNRLL